MGQESNLGIISVQPARRTAASDDEVPSDALASSDAVSAMTMDEYVSATCLQ